MFDAVPNHRHYYFFWHAVLILVVGTALSGEDSAQAHELWMESSPTAQTGAAHQIEVCWGHFHERAGQKTLKAQRDKISTYVVRPDADRAELTTQLDGDCLIATVTPEPAGCYVFGSELQTGIISRQLHSIPANTRIVMYGKTLTHVGSPRKGLQNQLGFDLEIVPLTAPDQLRPGGVVEAKLLLRDEPLGGGEVEVSLVTPGKKPWADHDRIQSHEWSIDAMPNPNSGQVAFPLVTAGPHLFIVRYVDENPGTYRGSHDFHTDFSHLQKGDAYERTMYISTLMVEVPEE